MLKSFVNVIQGLPRFMVQQHEEVVKDGVVLTTDNLKAFDVVVDTDDSGRFWFTDGWNTFLTANQIDVGCLFYIVYEGNSDFHLVTSLE